MLGRQKQVLEALLRAREFLRQYPAANAPETFDRTLRELEDTIGRIERAAAHQINGDHLARASTQQIRDKVQRLRDHHMKPVVAIARAAADIFPGVDLALVMPPRRISVVKLVAAAHAMRNAAEPHAEYMIQCGRAANFLERFDTAIADVLGAQRARDNFDGLGVGATAGLRMHLRRARRLLAIVECQVVESFGEDAVRMAEWRAAKRVQLKRGPSQQRAASPESSESPVVQLLAA